MAYWRRFYTDLQSHSEIVCYSAIDLAGTKDLKKGLAGRASKSKSKSESIEPKSKSGSKSSKNGLKSGLESKSGLEYYKSAHQQKKSLGSQITFRIGFPEHLLHSDTQADPPYMIGMLVKRTPAYHANNPIRLN